MFLNKVEYKSKRMNSPVYSNLVKVYGNSPQYTDNNYYSIAKEGYSENNVIFACLREIVQGCTQVEWKVYQTKSDGKDEEVINHPILKLLNKPNPLQSKEEFIERVMLFYYIGGDAPLHKIPLSRGTVGALYTYRPDKTTFTLTGDIDMPYDNIQYMSGGVANIKPKEFTLFKTVNPLDELDGLGRGLSPLSAALKNGDLFNSFIDWNVSLLQNGASPSGAWVTQESLDKNVYEIAEKRIQNKYSGTMNAGKTMLLDGGASWVKMGENPKDMDWVRGKESTIKDICSALRVDPIVIGYNEFSSYNNKKEAEKGLYNKVIIPLMNSLAGTLTRFLLPHEENIYITTDFSHIPVLQEDEEKRFERINNAKSLTLNEKRQELGKDEIEGGDIIGDVILINGKPYIPMNLVPSDFGSEE